MDARRFAAAAFPACGADSGGLGLRPIAQQNPPQCRRQPLQLHFDARHRRQRPITIQVQPPFVAFSFECQRGRHTRTHRYMLAGNAMPPMLSSSTCYTTTRYFRF